MAYQDYEQSIDQAEPVELHDFALEDTHWRLTSSAEDVVYQSNTYKALPCRRGEIEQSDDPSRSKVEVTLPRNYSLSNLYLYDTPEGEVTYINYRGHAGNFIIYFQGIVESCKFDTNWLPTLVVGPRSSSQPFVGKRRKHMRMCDRLLYDPGCTVDQNEFFIEGEVEAVSGITIVSSVFNSKDDGWFVLGKFLCLGAVRLIKYHNKAESTIRIDRKILNIDVGAPFIAYAGCDGSPDTCKNRFTNKPNYGGCEHLPVRNPFLIGGLT